MKRLIVIALLLAAPALAQVQDGDRFWNARAEGSQNGRAKAGPVDAAIAAYQRAIVQNPNDVEAHWKLLRAHRFKGQYVASTTEEKKRVYSEAKNAGEKALALVDRLLSAKGLRSVSKATEKQVAEVAKTIPGADETFLWDSINWGEWALVYGKLAAARQGAADRIRREATIAYLIDPKMEAGTPARVLGRLHDQTPRIPFITGWASSREAVRFLEESLKIDPQNAITIVFLAEAMVSTDASTKPRAIQLLKSAIRTPDPEFVVEQTAAQNDARALLRKWGA
jgi:tetratricopeptide (TPR) repeat protein